MITLDDLTLDEATETKRHSTRPSGTDMRQYLRWGLAFLSLGAAGIHFAVMGDHFNETWYHGSFFAAIAWLQLAWAVAIVMKPSRKVLIAGIVGSLVIVEVWLVSRTIGIPFGPNSGQSEPVAFADVLSTILEGGIALGSLALLRPSFLDRPVRSARAVPGVAGVGVLVAALATLSLTPAYASAHNHGGSSAAPGAAGHSHGSAAVASGTGFAVGASPCEKSGPAASEGQLKDAEGHNHRGPAKQEPMDFNTRQQLAQQQLIARAVVARFPTVADALKAGYQKSTPYVPCIGAHYTNTSLAVRFDFNAPSELLYDGTTPDAKIVGLSYLVYHPNGAPEGFAGPNDRWHQHTFNGGLCINGEGLVVGAESTSPAECKARGGSKVSLENIWMLHDWVAPGWECSWGVFASECPELGGRIGSTAFSNNGA